jgi:hypothetical protein
LFGGFATLRVSAARPELAPRLLLLASATRFHRKVGNVASANEPHWRQTTVGKSRKVARGVEY